MIYIYQVLLNEMIEKNFMQLLNYVEEETRNRILNFRFCQDSYRTLLGRLLLKYVLKKHYYIMDYKIGYNKYGRPYLVSSDIDFNIAHSKQMVVCAISDERIGIDVEWKKIFCFQKNVEEFEKQFMKEHEIMFLNMVPKETRDEMLCKYWIAKEALVKYIGTGLVDINKHYICWKNRMEATVIWKEKKLSILEFDDDEYMMSVCNEAYKSPIIRESINVEALINSLE